MDLQQDSFLFDDEDSRLSPVNILASSPPSSLPEDGVLISSRPTTLLRSRRNVAILPILSTSPTATTPSPHVDITTPPSPPPPPVQFTMQCVSTPVNSLQEAFPSVPPPPPTTLPQSNICIADPSKNTKPPTAKDLETQYVKSQETGQKLDISDFECSLCFRVFFQPVTTVCGHVFCKQCLFNALKYNLNCPLCRHKLAEGSSKHGSDQKYSVNIVLMNIIEKYFPQEYQERMLEERVWQQKASESCPKQSGGEDEGATLRPPSPSNWSCLLPSLRSTCNVILSCGGF